MSRSRRSPRTGFPLSSPTRPAICASRRPLQSPRRYPPRPVPRSPRRRSRRSLRPRQCRLCRICQIQCICPPLRSSLAICQCLPPRNRYSPRRCLCPPLRLCGSPQGRSLCSSSPCRPHSHSRVRLQCPPCPPRRSRRSLPPRRRAMSARPMGFPRTRPLPGSPCPLYRCPSPRTR